MLNKSFVGRENAKNEPLTDFSPICPPLFVGYGTLWLPSCYGVAPAHTRHKYCNWKKITVQTMLQFHYLRNHLRSKIISDNWINFSDSFFMRIFIRFAYVEFETEKMSISFADYYFTHRCFNGSNSIWHQILWFLWNIFYHWFESNNLDILWLVVKYWKFS